MLAPQAAEMSMGTIAALDLGSQGDVTLKQANGICVTSLNKPKASTATVTIDICDASVATIFPDFLPQNSLM
jgi:hypothetical protein